MTRARRRAGLTAMAAALVAGGAAVGTGTGAGGPADGSEDVLRPVGRYATGIAGGTSGETAALVRDRLYVTNSTGNSLDVVDVADPAAPRLLRRIDLSPYGAGPNSVAATGELVAVAVEADPPTDPGRVVLLDPEGAPLKDVAAGALPDMLTFTRDGRRVVVANEGEASGYGTPDAVDPEGSVSIVDVGRVARGGEPTVRTVSFAGFDAGGPRNGELPEGLRLNGPGASVAEDLEPEYVTVSADDRTARVTLQENNGVARIDLRTGRVAAITALGTKDHSRPGAGLDPSDRDGGIRIGTWPVRGLYMPDAAASFRVRGRDYLVTANEGDARDRDGLEDEARAGDLELDAGAFPDAAALQAPEALGRLNVSRTDGRGADGEYEALYSFGARSATIWTGDGAVVWDSGDAFERRIAAELPAAHNVDNEDSAPDSRSDNKGPEPEGVAVGRVGGRTYAFVGLERVGGVMVVDVSAPARARVVQWARTRDDTATPPGPDSGPEVVSFVEAKDSPTGAPLVVVANEVSGTVNLFSAARR